MEEKVKCMLKLIEEDADSFAKRAEMYYRKRPELLNFVEESYRAYRALAERYDHISGELHNANHAIATVFPDQVQFSMADEDGDDSLEVSSSLNPSKFYEELPENPQFSIPNKDIRIPSSLRKMQARRTSSQMNKDKAKGELDKLQKGILALQTQKEFIKSSYERGLANYLKIEKQIMDMQEEVIYLQDEFSVDAVIEDEEARLLMTETALKSCENTLVKLQEQQIRSTEEAILESERIRYAEEKMNALKEEFLHYRTVNWKLSDEAMAAGTTSKNLEEEVCSLKQERQEVQSICKKLKEQFEMNPDTSLTMAELADKINELVNKVIGLESAVSSQNGQIQRLRSEINEFHIHLTSLEDDKMTLTDGSKNLSGMVRELEEELHGIQDLSLSVLDENNKLLTHFAEAHRNLNDLSEKLQSPKQQDDIEIMGSSQAEENFHNVELHGQCKEQKHLTTPTDEFMSSKAKIAELEEEPNGIQDHNLGATAPKQQEDIEIMSSSQAEENFHNVELHGPCKEQKHMTTPTDEFTSSKAKIAELEEEPNGIHDHNLGVKVEKEHFQSEGCCNLYLSEKLQEPKQKNEVEKSNSSQAEGGVSLDIELQKQNVEQEDSPNWQQLLLNGLGDREKILLAEYTSILRNYKETKRRLSEVEKKNQDTLFEMMAQTRELKSSNATKDEEIRSLRQQISFLQTSFDENSNYQLIKFNNSQHSKPDHTLDASKSWFSDFQTGISNQVISEPIEERTVESTENTNKSSAVIATGIPPTEEIEIVLINVPDSASTVEEKFRRDIDILLEENLEFWLRFTSSFQQIQKFRTTIQDLQAEYMKLKDERKMQEGSTTAEQLVKSEAAHINNNLRELQAELSVWLEQNALLKEELQSRLSSLCNIQKEISRVSKNGSETKEVEFHSHQAAKFQGEILNMQQENNKVADELQAGLDHVRGLQSEVAKTLTKLHDSFELSGSKNHRDHMNHSTSRTRIPLRNFIFRVKPKKPSIFSCMNPVALQKQYSDLSNGFII